MTKKLWLVIVYMFAAVGFALTAGYAAVRFGLTNAPGIIDTQTSAFLRSEPAWARGEEWDVLKLAITKDRQTILDAAASSSADARLIVSLVAAEQLRLFYTNRELFKRVFDPLKILGDQSQFSWGILGIKETSAKEIERRLGDLGPRYARLLDFKTNDTDKERYERLTDPKNRYYDYLYAGLYLAEIAQEWREAGFSISERPDILSTLYNIGFVHSHPNAHPLAGGAEISLDGKSYGFGTLAESFYCSDELTTEFPKQKAMCGPR